MRGTASTRCGARRPARCPPWGAFRVVPARELRDHCGREADPRNGDLRHLREQRLIETVRLPGRRDMAVVLTDRGRDLLESHRDRGHDHHQEFYAGLKRERELEHDSQVYQAYLSIAERLEERDARIDPTGPSHATGEH